jgi:hypothetical protein
VQQLGLSIYCPRTLVFDGYQDGEVMDAVEELLQRKARLSELQELLAMADSK